ncbi:Helix-turn-helix domain-containing protein [Terribacillus halophilus]|uniref:Helix-turn-helix domain-containing protein n=1 Tax=Terribacillus halophilus TaxID=361279 RepID=A0A1G6PK40_9BACI|nr:helix-turn-helix transcriptional regulator [Terribacillus halophilus]SDC80612.1 Helix-turn-helix domain-containing protein [Terribacillus halophilus]
MFDEKQLYLLKRRQKKIKHRQLAEYLKCSQSLISRYETGDCSMSDSKIEKYKEFIDRY